MEEETMSSVGNSLISLPPELLDQILANPNLDMRDVVNFASTCSHLNETVLSSNRLWKTKFTQRWPRLRENLETRAIFEPPCLPIYWPEAAKERALYAKHLALKLSKMSSKHSTKKDLSMHDLAEYNDLVDTNKGPRKMVYKFCLDELRSILDIPESISSPTDEDLTKRYYAEKVVRYLLQRQLTEQWDMFLVMPACRQTTEIGAIVVAMWCQPEKHITFRSISEKLDEIAELAKAKIAEKYPDIGIYDVPREELDRWKIENLYENQWSKEDSRNIVTTLSEVMFIQLGFHGYNDMFYESKNSLINQVLIHKKGIPISLAIIFESVARRLGLHCETVSFPAHFLLRWKEKYNSKTPEESYYIDVFNGGRFLTKKHCSVIGGAGRCPIDKNNKINPTSAPDVVERLAHNLELAGRQRGNMNGRSARMRSALELLHLVKPFDTGTILLLARYYMLNEMDVTYLITILDEIMRLHVDIPDTSAQARHVKNLLEDYKKRVEYLNVQPTTKVRTPDVKYAVGMILQDRFANLCVVTGWDAELDSSCANELETCDRLTHGFDQPFYHVYVDGGYCRYAPQETLWLTTEPRWVNHHEIGRYFCRFMGNHYLPNDEKASEYPEDIALLNYLYRTTQNLPSSSTL